MEYKIFTINLKNTTLSLKSKIYSEDEEIDIEELLRTDISNLPAEIVTSPVILHRFGGLLALAEERVNLAKLKIEVHEGAIADVIRKKFFEDKGKAATNEHVNKSISKDKIYQTLKKNYFSRIKERDILNSAYWALKAKDQKINDLIKGNLDKEGMEEYFLQKRLNTFNDVDIKKNKA